MEIAVFRHFPVPGGTVATRSPNARPGTGPKIMGYQFFTRNSVSILRGKYSDKQENTGAETSDDLNNVKITGKRYTLEHYPVVHENYPTSDYGYALLEYRNESARTLYRPLEPKP